MAMAEIQETIDALDALLETERQALLKGEIDSLAELHEEKASLVEKLRVLDLQDRDEMSRLNDKITRNQALLSSALDGIRSVAQRLAEVRHVRENLDTYDAQGRKVTVSTRKDATLEKRA